MRRRLLALAAGAAVLLGAPAPVLAAGEQAVKPVVRTVDASKYPEVRLEVGVPGQAPALNDFHVRENGAAIPEGKISVRPLAQSARPVGTVLVIDTSGSMRSNGALEQAKAAAHQFVNGRGSNEWMAVVSFSSAPIVRSGFTQDPAALGAAIDALQPKGETALWDALIMASGLYQHRPDLQANLVLLSDGADSISSGTRTQAVAAIDATHSAVYAVGIASAEFDPTVITGLVGSAGGSATTTGNPAELTAQFATIRSAIENQYEVTYTSTGTGGALVIDLTVGGAKVEAQTRAGVISTGNTFQVATPARDLVGSSGGKGLLFLLAALAAGLAVFAAFLIFSKREDTLDDRLGVYGGMAVPLIGEGTGAPGSGSFVESGFVRRAVSITSRMAERGGLLVKVERMLEQANLPLRPAEALFFYGAGVVLVGAALLFSAPTIAVGVIFAVILAAVPIVALRQLRKRRLKAFEAQLPDTLNLLSGSLRAGYSFLQGLEAVAEETSDPMARELRRVLAEARLGRPLEDALADVAVRMESNDFDWSVMAIRIQREVGGNLAELLQTVAETMVERSRLRGEVKALTAEGRISGIIMGLLPVGLGLFMFTASPDYIDDLFSSATGWAMVVGSVVMAVAGFGWIQKIIKIEV